MSSNIKQVHVAAAIIVRDEKDPESGEMIRKVFATQRGYGELKDGWELPGGKLEPGEQPEDTVVREIREELDTEIRVERYIDTIQYDYPTFHLTMDCFLCTIVSGKLILKEHEASKWLGLKDLSSVDWLPADTLILEEIREILSTGTDA